MMTGTTHAAKCVTGPLFSTTKFTGVEKRQVTAGSIIAAERIIAGEHTGPNNGDQVHIMDNHGNVLVLTHEQFWTIQTMELREIPWDEYSDKCQVVQQWTIHDVDDIDTGSKEQHDCEPLHNGSFFAHCDQICQSAHYPWNLNDHWRKEYPSWTTNHSTANMTTAK